MIGVRAGLGDYFGGIGYISDGFLGYSRVERFLDLELASLGYLFIYEMKLYMPAAQEALYHLSIEVR